MNFPFYIARRYLFSKKSHNAINIISTIGVCGVTLATMALVCTMAVFSGFRQLVSSLFTEFDAQLVITPTKGKYFSATADPLHTLAHDEDIAAVSHTFTQQALIAYGGKQVMATLKGVDDNFRAVSHIATLLEGTGKYELHTDVSHFGIMGIQLAGELGLGYYYPDALQVYAPRSGQRINAANPAESFNHGELYSPGVVFNVRQSKYDSHYLITSLKFMQTLYDRPQQVTAIELRLTTTANEARTKARLQAQLGTDYKVTDRYELHEESYRTMEIEKLMAYFFLVLIVLIATFNIIGSLSMLIIDKRNDVQTLRNLGATDSQIRHIFMSEGILISTLGAVFGTLGGVLLSLGQQHFGWLKLGSSSGNFIIDHYPVSIEVGDVATILATVIIVGIVSVWYPVRYLTNRLL
ncbi:MAG: FtsX-like permease family protein [Bacteroidales bacterium]|nr:FtsX-like permease family protein [Bacteroidales bacterium]